MWVLRGSYFHVFKLLPIIFTQQNLPCISTWNIHTHRIGIHTSLDLVMLIENAHLLIP